MRSGMQSLLGGSSAAMLAAGVHLWSASGALAHTGEVDGAGMAATPSGGGYWIMNGHGVRAPTLHAVDSQGAGDSFTAATAAALARGASVVDAVRLGAAAGSLNVTRRGLASGNRDEIERMAAHVTVRPR